MDFIFADKQSYASKSLMQGDLLLKTEELAAVLGEAHGYYASAPDYTHFMVLTQSCDLVRRNGKKPKARYITVAAVRPLKLVVNRRAEKAKFGDVENELNVCDLKSQITVEQFVERLINNTEDGFFCLPAEAHDKLSDDLCVFLHLSVALRSDHYEACLNAKMAQLDDIFAAKLGWLTGNMYSRVATPDVQEKMGDDGKELKSKIVHRVLNKETLWLSSAQLKELKKAMKREDEVTPEKLRELVENIPDDFSFVVNRMVEIAQNNGFASELTAEALRNLLLSDVNLKKRVLNTIR